MSLVALIAKQPSTSSLPDGPLEEQPPMPDAVKLEVGLDGSAQPLPPVPVSPRHCAGLACFEDLVRSRATGRSRTVVLAMTNAGFAPFWHNMRCSLERVNVSQHAIIIGTDSAACDAAASDSVPCVIGTHCRSKRSP